MVATKLKLAALGLVAAIGLGGCTDGYGYSGVNVGYNSGGYYDGYGDGYYGGGYGGGGYPVGFGGSYFGWYGDYYYPGSGYYVYGRDRRPVRWNDQQRRYWEGRRGSNGNWGNGQGRPNWQGFDRDRGRPGFDGNDGRGRPNFDRGNRPDRPNFDRGDRPAFTGNVGGDRGRDRGAARQDWRGNGQAGQTARPQFQRENRPGMGQRSFQGRSQGTSGRGGGRQRNPN